MTFDTLTAARELESAKFSREQAEAIAKTVRDGQGELATKADVAALENSTKAGIAALGHSTNANIAALGHSTNANIAALENSMNTSIAALENSMNTSIAALENSTNANTAALEIRLVKWAIGLAFAVAAIVLAGVRLMLDTGA
ncbi:MAG: hypothetical protein OXC65_14690 [Thiotrichales bacterium]|nr:hypothetical protein [Thiotrichales bacterium]